jgi:hypothetical protein
MLIGTHLLQRIQCKPGMTTVFPAIEPLRADEAGDGMDLPIYNINIGGDQSFGAAVQRNGLRPKIAKGLVDESSYPWITRSCRPSPQHQPSRARVGRTSVVRSVIRNVIRCVCHMGLRINSGLKTGAQPVWAD